MTYWIAKNITCVSVSLNRFVLSGTQGFFLLMHHFPDPRSPLCCCQDYSSSACHGKACVPRRVCLCVCGITFFYNNSELLHTCSYSVNIFFTNWATRENLSKLDSMRSRILFAKYIYIYRIYLVIIMCTKQYNSCNNFCNF